MQSKIDDFNLYDRVQCLDEPRIAKAIRGRVGSITEIKKDGPVPHIVASFGNTTYGFTNKYIPFLKIIKKSVTANTKENPNG